MSLRGRLIDAATVGDVSGTLRATVGFALVLLLPGYALGGWLKVAIGVAGTVYETVLLRVYLPVQERSGNPEVVGLSERAAALRMGLMEMNRLIDTNAVVQFDSNHPSEYFRYAQIQFANRQITSALPSCTVAFGGDARDCVSVEARTAALFAVERGQGEGVMSAAEAKALCAGLGTTDLVATRWDGVWQDHAGWVWNLPKVVDTGDVRVVSCGR
jgi:hypothetical protein